MDKEQLYRRIRIIKRKKWVPVVAIIVIAAIIIVPCIGTFANAQKRFSAKPPIKLSEVFVKQTDRSKINLVAHRGFSSQAPENTIPAITRAGENGFKTVEIDIRLTQDGVWVLSHDEKINSMTDKKGKISSLTYFDIVSCNINNGANHKSYEGIKIPTLEQALKACLEHNIKPMIEIKDYTEKGIENLVEILDKNGLTESCYVISFNRDLLEKIHRLNNQIPLCALVTKLNNKEMKKCLENPKMNVSFCGSKKINSEKKIKQLQNAGIELFCWTVDDAETMQKYFAMGVTNFVTNRVYKTEHATVQQSEI